MSFLKKHDKILHLTDEQVEKLVLRYYAGEKASDLIKEYNLNISSSKLYTIFPPEICSDLVCPTCNINMVRDRESKTSYSYSWRRQSTVYCYKCGHVNDYRICRCDNCQTMKQEEARKRAEEARLIELRKREAINDTYSLNKHCRIDFSTLTLRDKVYLGTLLRACLSEDLTTICPVEFSNRKLAPTNELTREIVVSLSNKNIIVVSPDSPIEAFTESEDAKFPNVYYTYKVYYHLNLEFQQNKQELINLIMNPPEFNKSDSDEAYALWKDIALSECLEYLIYQMNDVKFEFNPGEKTNTVFSDLLNKYAVSQIYGIIYKSVAQATKFYQAGNVSKKQAANSVIGNCQRFGERAEVQKWELTKYKRTKECLQTVVSEFFFNRVLKIGDLGFNMPPTIL